MIEERLVFCVSSEKSYEVIKGLEYCLDPTTYPCDHLCPYRDKYEEQGYKDCMNALLSDVLELVKWQKEEISKLKARLMVS